MEHLNEDKVEIFNRFYSNDTLTLLKIFSFFMDDNQRLIIAVFIKYMELNICLQKSMRNHVLPCSCCPTEQPGNMEDILAEIGDYLPQEGRDMMERFKNMKETYESYSQMMEMMNMMQETDNENIDLESILKTFNT